MAQRSEPPDTRSASDLLLKQMARWEHSDSLAFDRPLYEAIVPEALDTLFQADMGDITVEFTYPGPQIVIEGNDHIHITTPETNDTGGS